MSIRYNEESSIFTIETKSSTYQMQIGKLGNLLHLYYGEKVTGEMGHLIVLADRGFSGNPYSAGDDRTYSLDALPQEYPTDGTGDYRTTCLTIKNSDSTYSCDFRYKSHSIYEGKYHIPGLPAVYGDAEEASTLEITLEDTVSDVEVTLLYGVLEEHDVITRSVKVRNVSAKEFTIEKVLTACIDFIYGQWDWYSFYGRHAMERNMQKAKIHHGIQGIGSKRGTSSHQYNPFIVIADTKTTEDDGACYGLNFVYSGGFKAEIEKDQYDQTRVVMGVMDDLFAYELEPGGIFYAPEVVMSFSAKGLTNLTHNYHNLFRNNLIRGKYKHKKRPVLINTWEATYFDFDGNDILSIADEAASIGIEMLVLDDGWFGKRNNDTSGLGDWCVNEGKLGGTLSDLVKQINDKGLKFGLWFEPEMINEESELYRQHSDWALTIPDRKPVRGRSQLVLDYSRKEVVDYMFKRICAVLDSANVAYIKWDFNRSISDVYSLEGKNSQGAVMYHYIIGLYDLLERLTIRYPDLLIETCSGGGGRFDAGMLYYSPQIWGSDNTEAIDRITILEGTAFAYPISTIGSHVSVVPNHQNGRTTGMRTRAAVAMAGTFGYELNLNTITQDEKAEIKEQIQQFHQYWHLIHEGDYYRLTSTLEKNSFAAWQFTSKDKSEALLNVITMETHGNPLVNYIKFKGLKHEALYEMNDSDKLFSGSMLMNAGYPLPFTFDEYQTMQFHLKEIQSKA